MIYTLPDELPDPPWLLFDDVKEKLKGLKKRSISGGATIESNVVMKGSVVVGEGTIIRSGSYIVGPVVIGKFCEIGPCAYVRPITVMEDTSRVRFSSEIRCSILRSGVMVDHLSFIGDSIIGRNCNIGAGTIIANQRYDCDEIYIKYKGKRINTHRKFLGAIIGDNVIISINSSINCGTIIESKTVVEGRYGFE